MKTEESKNCEERTLEWFHCDNIVNPKYQHHQGLLNLNQPRVFLLVRITADADYKTFDEFKKQVEYIFFLDNEDVEPAKVNEILLDAYNYLQLDSRIVNQNNDDF